MERFCSRSYEHLGDRAPYDKESVVKMLQVAVSNPRVHRAWIADCDGEVEGILIAITNKVWFSKKRQAIDLFFYVAEKARGSGASLLRRYIKWASVSPGVVEIWITSTKVLPERYHKLMTNMGFEQSGANYSMGVDHE